MLLDYESDAIAAEKAGDAIQIVYPQADDPDPDADRGHEKSSHKTQAQAFVNWQWSHGRADDLGPAGLPPGARVGGQAVHEQVPDAAAAVHDRLPRRLDEGQEDVLRPVDGSITKIEQAAGVPTASS